MIGYETCIVEIKSILFNMIKINVHFKKIVKHEFKMMWFSAVGKNFKRKYLSGIDIKIKRTLLKQQFFI